MNLLGMMQNFGRGGHRGRGRGRGRWLKWILMLYTFLSFTLMKNINTLMNIRENILTNEIPDIKYKLHFYHIILQLSNPIEDNKVGWSLFINCFNLFSSSR